MLNVKQLFEGCFQSAHFLYCKWNLSQFSTVLCEMHYSRRTSDHQTFNVNLFKTFSRNASDWSVRTNKFYWFQFFLFFCEIFTSARNGKPRFQFVDKVFALNIRFKLSSFSSTLSSYRTFIFIKRGYSLDSLEGFPFNRYLSLSLRVMLRLRKEVSKQTQNRLIKDDRWPSGVAIVSRLTCTQKPIHNRIDLALVSSNFDRSERKYIQSNFDWNNFY